MSPTMDPPRALEEKGAHGSEKTTVSVIGCERIGILHACLLAEAGFRVLCVDYDRALIEQISKGRAPFLNQEIEPILQKGLENKKIQVSCSLEEAAGNEIILVSTAVKVNERGAVDYSDIERIFKKVGSHLRKNALVINVSTVGIGVNEGIIRETIENASGFKVGEDVYFAYCPVPLPEKQTLRSLANCRRIVAAQDKASLEKASNIMAAITRAGFAKSLDLKAAEAAVLFETLCRNVDSALANEFAAFCEKIGVDYLSAQSLVFTSVGRFSQLAWDSFGGEKALPLLFEAAETQNVKLKISQTALELSKEMARRIVSLVQDALKSCGKSIRRAKIAVLGASQTPNVADVPKSSLKDFVKMLERKGAKPSIYDPYLSQKVIDLEPQLIKENLMEALEGVDCIVIFTGHEQFKRLNLRKIKLLANMPTALVDLERLLEPAKVEAEGFVYRGLGRGVWKK
ncbi:MAG: nucleotide sugar dehydrogenase [Candidatus Bathyarchaeia archaeon]